jgi:signal transduction histidine kinase
LGSLIAYAIIMVNRLSLNAVNLNKKNGELINTNKELDVFIFSASHDMRSPITSTKGLIDIALEEEDITRIKQYLKLLKGVANKQDIFIQEIIDFFKNKRTAIAITKVNLPDLVSDVLDQHWYAIEADGITIETKLDISQLYCDELRIRMILNNLISNSVKYIDKRKQDKKIRIRAWKSFNDYTIEVEDNGIGIKKEKQPSIFNMFFVTESNKKSSGLGLYIVHETVMKLNGTIELYSEEHGGTKITITLPLTARLHENQPSFEDIQVLQ